MKKIQIIYSQHMNEITDLIVSRQISSTLCCFLENLHDTGIGPLASYTIPLLNGYTVPWLHLHRWLSMVCWAYGVVTVGLLPRILSVLLN